MKKRKSLSKKIDRLKTRLASDAKKLAKLTMKLGAATTGGKSKGKRKKATGSRHSAPMKRPAAVQQPEAAPKVKKKLNLTPERRAQLAAAMKARWDAKRAAAAANSQGAPTTQEFPAADGSHSLSQQSES